MDQELKRKKIKMTQEAIKTYRKKKKSEDKNSKNSEDQPLLVDPERPGRGLIKD